MSNFLSLSHFPFSIRCFSEESCLSIPDVEGYVVVLQPDAPQILLSGSSHFARPASDFEDPEGVPLFPDLQISCSISHQVEAKKDESWHGTGKLHMREPRSNFRLWPHQKQKPSTLDLGILDTSKLFVSSPGCFNRYFFGFASE